MALFRDNREIIERVTSTANCKRQIQVEKLSKEVQNNCYRQNQREATNSGLQIMNSKHKLRENFVTTNSRFICLERDRLNLSNEPVIESET